MNSIKISRTEKEEKSRVLSMRLTSEQYDAFANLSKSLKFNSHRDLLLYCMDIMSQLYIWHKDGNKFMVGKKNNWNYVDFEFEPSKKENQ